MEESKFIIWVALILSLLVMLIGVELDNLRMVVVGLLLLISWVWNFPRQSRQELKQTQRKVKKQ